MPITELLEVRDKIKGLRANPPSIFGSEDHGFELNPVLSEGAVIAFEQKHGVRLPDDYREFLTAVGNGGAGPFYGVFPLGVVDSNFDFREWREGDGLVGVLREPFPLDEPWNDLSKMPEIDRADLDKTTFEQQQEEFDSTYWGDALVNGAFPICHEGCAIRVLLVVTGAQAGKLWEDRRSEYGGLLPLKLKDGSPATFGGWYTEWLRRCIAAARSAAGK